MDFPARAAGLGPAENRHPDARAAGAGHRAPRGAARPTSCSSGCSRQRIVFIGAEIDDDLANRVCSQLLLLAAQDGQRDIKVFINSPGGSMDAMFAMYDVMKYLPNDVSTVGLGMAASAGQFLLTAGTAGKRYALRNTRIMMHQPSGGIRRHRVRHPHPGRAVPAHEAPVPGADRRAHRAAVRADRARRRPRPLLHRRRGEGVRPDRPRRDQRAGGREVWRRDGGGRPLHPAVVRRAHLVRDEGDEPVQQAVRGADRLRRRARSTTPWPTT